MADQRREGTDDRRTDDGRRKRPEPVPRDMPDQQFHGQEDRWDLSRDRRRDEGRHDEPGDTDETDETDSAVTEDEADEELPATDEAGTRRRGVPPSEDAHPGRPEPDEPPG